LFEFDNEQLVQIVSHFLGIIQIHGGIEQPERGGNVFARFVNGRQKIASVITILFQLYEK
jgi:hypothetical protein